MVKTASSPFGSTSRTEALLALRLLGQSYPRELTRITGIRLSAMQGALRSLERDGLVVARLMGRTRVFEINPRYFARGALLTYLDRLVEPDRDLQRAIASLRRRPRRTGKPL